MNLNNEKGQTSVEYILLIAVIVAVMTSVFNRLEEYLITNPDSLQNQFLKDFESTFNGFNGQFEGQYKYFIIRK